MLKINATLKIGGWDVLFFLILFGNTRAKGRQYLPCVCGLLKLF